MENKNNSAPSWDDTVPVWEETTEVDSLGTRNPSEETLDPQQRLNAQNRPLDAAMAGLGNTFSFGDEMGAGVQKLLNLLPNSPVRQDEALREAGFTGDIQEKSYDDLVAENKAERLALKSENALPYNTAVTLGTLATLPIGLTGKVKTAISAAAPTINAAGSVLSKSTGLPTVGKLLSNPLAIESGILAGVEAAGESEGSLSKDPKTLVKDTLKGTGLGLGLGKLTSMVGDNFAKSAANLDKSAARKALAAAGFKPSDLKGLSNDQIDALGRRILDEKLITPFGRANDMVEKLAPKIDAQETKLGAALDKIEKFTEGPANMGVGSVKRVDLANNIKESIRKEYEGFPESELDEMFSKVDEWVLDSKNEKKLLSSLEAPLKELQKKKVALNKAIKSTGFAKEDAGKTLEAYRKIRQGYRGAIEDKAEAAAEWLGKDGLEVKDINKDLGQLYQMEKVAEKKALKDSLKPTNFDTAEKIGILKAIATGDVKSLVGTGALKAGRTYGDNMSALATNKAASMAKSGSKLVEYTAPLTSRLAGQEVGEDDETKGNVKSYADMSPEDLQMIAERALAGGTKEDEELATMLSLTAQKEGLAKTAELFKIMQNPKYRMKLNELKK